MRITFYLRVPYLEFSRSDCNVPYIYYTHGTSVVGMGFPIQNKHLYALMGPPVIFIVYNRNL
jgi:hypothetical protein